MVSFDEVVHHAITYLGVDKMMQVRHPQLVLESFHSHPGRCARRAWIVFGLVLLLVPKPLRAQNWVVGGPVNAVLSHAYLFAGSCTPDPSHRFAFPTSPVSGVTYAAIVTLAYPGNMITMVPGPVAPLQAGDTIWITDPSMREVFYPPGGGNLNLEFRAIGIPALTGEAHPCAVNDTWLSDLGLCPETLSITLQNACATTSATSITPAPEAQPWFSIASDGLALKTDDPTIVDVQIYDMQGRVDRMAGFSKNSGQLDLGGQPNGQYVARATRKDGSVLIGRFTLVR